MVVNDKFEQYFIEKIWDLIPAWYRHEDGIAADPDVLREIVEVVAKQAVHLRRSQDRAWEDQYIELSKDWAVPYIGALVGTRILPALNKRGSRIDVAKTIYYRRRKGTAVVLEEIITDITGWTGKLVETFRNLSRAWHRLDPFIASRDATETQTPMGGFSNLRSVVGSLATGTAFDSFSHTPDVRRPIGNNGVPNIPVMVFHLYPLGVYTLRGVQPYEVTAGVSYTFDPSGRDIPLFHPGSDTFDWSTWHSPQPWDIAYRMTCERFNDTAFVITEADIIELGNQTGLSTALLDELRTIRDLHYKRESDFINALSTLPGSATFLAQSVYHPLYAMALQKDTGRSVYATDSLEIFRDSSTQISSTALIGEDLSVWNTVPVHEKEVAIDAERGRFSYLSGTGTPSATTTYTYALSYGIGAGGHDRRHVEEVPVDGGPTPGGGAFDASEIYNDGVSEITDSATYSPVSDKLSVKSCTIQAANRQRPYLFLTTNWVLNTTTNKDSELNLDGLWLGCEANEKLIIRGNYECVRLSHMTLDPGGKQSNDTGAADVNPVVLRIGAHIETLIIEKSILGQIEFSNRGYVENFIIRDSILQAPSLNDNLLITKSELYMERVTAFGRIQGQHIHVTDSIVVGRLRAVDNQIGCVRFSAIPFVPKLPRPYKCVNLDNDTAQFHSQRFGEPTYFRLRESVDSDIRMGAEDGLEMGAFNKALTEIKLESLKIKVQEYMPFGRLPGFVMNV